MKKVKNLQRKMRGVKRCRSCTYFVYVKEGFFNGKCSHPRNFADFKSGSLPPFFDLSDCSEHYGCIFHQRKKDIPDRTSSFHSSSARKKSKLKKVNQ